MYVPCASRRAEATNTWSAYLISYLIIGFKIAVKKCDRVLLQSITTVMHYFMRQNGKNPETNFSRGATTSITELKSKVRKLAPVGGGGIHY